MAETRTTSSTGGQKGVKLARFDLIPVGPLTALAEHYGVGATKYADNQWRKGYEWSKTYAALMRHLTAWWAGYDYDVCSNDPEGCSHVDAEGRPFVAIREDACFNHTGSHHLAAVAWHAFAAMEFAENFPEHDDRFRRPEPEEEETADIGSWSQRWICGIDQAHGDWPVRPALTVDEEPPRAPRTVVMHTTPSADIPERFVSHVDDRCQTQPNVGGIGIEDLRF